MKKIKYMIHYDTDTKEGRKYFLSATNKADYIFSVLADLGYDVEVISASTASKSGFYKGKTKKLSDNVYLKLFPAIRQYKRPFSVLSGLWGVLVIFLWLLFAMKKDETLMSYHSVRITKIIAFVHRIKKFNWVLETEEIYNDVSKGSRHARKAEVDSISCADVYIFPTELLNKELNKGGKPYAIIHGTYKAEPSVSEKFSDGKIHVVYAGTFDPRKGGVAAAAAAAGYLPYNYHVHILGFGTENETAVIKSKIKEVNKSSEAEVTYDGLLGGAEYTKFLQSCDIGLSTQNPDADFNATSFPSKILSYMANGLRVVSIKIPAVEGSAIGKYMYYYDNQTPKEIAEAIKSVSLDDNYDGIRIITELDDNFCREVKRLLK